MTHLNNNLSRLLMAILPALIAWGRGTFEPWILVLPVVWAQVAWREDEPSKTRRLLEQVGGVACPFAVLWGLYRAVTA